MTGEEIAGLVASAGLDAAVEPSARVGAAGAVADAAGAVAGAVTVTITVPAGRWLALLTLAREQLGCDFFDWLSAVDEAAAGVAVLAHVYSLAGRHHLLLRTVLAGDQPRLPTASGVYRGAAWHERETGEMFGVIFDGHPGPGPLLLPDGFEGHPLRKDFPLAARAAQEWPGAREPGEPAEPGQPVRGRRRAVPPGVPDGWPAG
jgi:NADH-quinone oxidoreductase subunit C